MFGVVIEDKVAWTVEKDCPYAFEYMGGYYVWDKDFLKAFEYYKNKEEK